MSTKIEIEYKDNKYTLEYTRKSVENLQRRGFSLSDVTEKPNIVIPMLFAGAFIANHKKTKQETIDEMYRSLPDKEGLLTTLITMYNETASTLFDDPDEDDEGNASWKAI